MSLDLDFFEIILLHNAIKSSSYCASVIDNASLDYFENKDVRCIFDKVREFFIEHKTPPSLTEIKTRLSTDEHKHSFKEVLTEFKKLDSDYNNNELLANTETFLRTRAVYKAILKSAEALNSDSKIESSSILKTFEKACNISLVDNLGLDYLYEIDKHIESLSTVNNYYSTGIKWLDKMLGGGIITTGKSLYIVGAGTNVGKSVILTNIAANVLAQGKKVVIFSLEMSEEMYAKRVSSCITKIPLKDLAQNPENLKQSIEEYKSIRPDSRLIIKEYPTKSVTVNTLKAFIELLIQKKGFRPDVIIVDYLSLLKPTLQTGNMYTDVKSITEELRGLTYCFGGIPCWSAVQMNREGVKKINPGLESTSESMGIAHTADVQLSLWADDTDKELGVLRMGMQKNRFGVNFGNTVLKIDYDTLHVSETNDTFVDSTEVLDAKSILEGFKND